MVCGLDLHRGQITFNASVDGEVWRGRLWQPNRERFRRWLEHDVRQRAGNGPVSIAVEGCTGWRYVVEEITAAGFEAHVAEPADTQAARGRKARAKTDRSDARLLRVLLEDGELPESWIPPEPVLEWRAALPRARLAIEIADDLIAYPILSVAESQRRHGRSNQANRNAIAALVDLEVLEPYGSARYDRLFWNRRVFQVIER